MRVMSVPQNHARRGRRRHRCCLRLPWMSRYGIGLLGVARRAGGLDGHVRDAWRARAPPGRFAHRSRRSRRSRGPAEVIDDQLEVADAAAATCADLREEARRHQRDRAARRAPPPATASRWSRPSATCSGAAAGNTKRRPSIPGRCFQRVDQRAALGLVEREVAEDRQPVGMLARGLDRQLVGVRVPRGRRGGSPPHRRRPRPSPSGGRPSGRRATCRWLGLVGLPLLQMWTCASTISMTCSSARPSSRVDDALPGPD